MRYNTYIYHYGREIEISTGSREGSKTKISEKLSNSILEEAENNPFITLNEMALLVGTKFHLVLSRSTISNFVHQKLISFKNVRTIVANKNSDENKLLLHTR